MQFQLTEKNFKDSPNYPEPNSGDTIAVWFSCGAASAVAAKKTIERYGNTCTIHVVNNPVAEEHEDNRRFLKDVEAWLGLPVEIAAAPDYPSCSAVDVWAKRHYMAGPTGAPCTVALKKMARKAWEEKNHVDWHVLGFTANEKHRADRFIANERTNLLPVLVMEGITKAECFIKLSDAGIRLPEVYFMGYPNANCLGCVKASSPTYWNHVRKVNPEVFEARAKQSRELGAKLTRYNGKRVFLDELPEDAVGQPMHTMKTECGIFCNDE